MRDRSKHKYGHKWVEHRIDPENQALLEERSWRIRRYSDGTFCVEGSNWINGRNVTCYLHRVIMNAPPGVQVDHINGDTLDNRRCNLRLCTHKENGHNRKLQGGTSKFKGVTWHKRDRKWQAGIRHNGKQIHLGYFNDDVEAARAYDRAARKYFGEFARVNFQG